MADDEADLSGDQAAAEAAAYSRAGSCAPSGLSGIDCDSGSEDEQPVEEFALDEQEQADTTARQHAEEGKDLQGIPWERLQVSRDRYRLQRVQQYRNYMNCIPEDEWVSVKQELIASWPQPTLLPQLHCPYQFVRNWRAVSSSIVHFQLRNLLWAASGHDVYVVYDNRVQHWNSITRTVHDMLDLRGAPKGPRLPGLGRVQVSTLCVCGDLLSAGGFTGELVLGRLTRSEPDAAWGDDDSDEDTQDDSDYTHTGGAAAGSTGTATAAAAVRSSGSSHEGDTEEPPWSAAGCSSCEPQQDWRPDALLQAASDQHGPATQRYCWTWEQRQPQQQMLQSNWQRRRYHSAQHWRGRCHQQQLQQQQWPPLVQLGHEQQQQPQRQQQEQQLQQRVSAQQHQEQRHRCLADNTPPRRQQQLQRHGDQECMMGAAGPAACEVLHSCRITQSENGITNGIEIFNSCSYGCCVMTSNNDCCVRLFDVEGCRPRQRLEFPFAVNYSTLRPEGAALGGGPVVAVVGDDPLTWLVDCRSGLEVMKLGGHRDFSFAVAWSPNGQLLATGNQDSTTRVWDVRQTSTPLAVLGGSMGAIRSLRFSPDGSCLAAAEPADFVHVYDVASNFSRVQEVDLFGEVAGISFSPDAQALFVAISDTLYSSLVQYQRSSLHRS